jgi:hypothetical protein
MSTTAEVATGIRPFKVEIPQEQLDDLPPPSFYIRSTQLRGRKSKRASRTKSGWV